MAKSTRKSTSKQGIDEHRTEATQAPSHDEIAVRAYEIYLARGAAGSDLDNWLEAERQLRGSPLTPGADMIRSALAQFSGDGRHPEGGDTRGQR